MYVCLCMCMYERERVCVLDRVHCGKEADIEDPPQMTVAITALHSCHRTLSVSQLPD